MTFRRWAEYFRSKNSHLWTFLREGEKALLDKEIPHIKRDASRLNVGDVLVADGHRLNFQVINPFTGKPCRATVLGYIDWKSWDLAGFEIMVEENTQVIAAALRQAIIKLGKMPAVSYQDRGKAFLATYFTSTDTLEGAGFYGLFGRLGIRPVFAAPYRARAKSIERFWKEFTGKFERLLPSFTGSSVEDKPAWMRMGEKFHRIAHNSYVPTIEETSEMVHLWIRDYWEQQPCPHAKGRTIGQVFEEGRGAGVDIRQLDDLMLATAVKTIHANGIRFLGSDYYDDVLFGLREQTVIKYSLVDLSYIQVYDKSGQFLCTAKRTMSVHPMARHLGDAKDLAEVRHRQNKHRSLQKAVVNAATEFIARREPLPPWSDIVPMTAKTIDQIEDAQARIALPRESEETHIPDFMLKRNQAKDPSPAVSPSEEPLEAERAEQPIDPRQEAEEPPTRPDFGMDLIPRYEFHLQNGCATEDDERWVAWFKTTPAYRDAYLFFESQAEEYQRKKGIKEAGHAHVR
jgi:putative transposase